MGIDYYGVLGLQKCALPIDIKRAFRRLALEYHPGRCQQPAYHSDPRPYRRFCLLAEAYDVLGDENRRAVYDQYGEEGLKEGVPGPRGFIPPYAYHGDPLKTYLDFFGTASPYADLLDVSGLHLDVFGLPEGRGYRTKDPPVVNEIHLTLEEVFNGSMKKILLRKRFLKEDGRTTETREKILTIPIAPGTAAGTTYTYKEEGDQGVTRIPADLIFVTRDVPHERFQRRGDDLVRVSKIGLKQALTGCIVTVPTLDKRILRLPVVRVVSPTYEKVVHGEGLPRSRNPKLRGDLIITFQTVFPRDLKKGQKQMIKDGLQKDLFSLLNLPAAAAPKARKAAAAKSADSDADE